MDGPHSAICWTAILVHDIVLLVAQTKDGAAKIRASMFGITVEELAVREKSEKHCMICRRWRDRSEFGADPSRHDGIASACRPCRRAKNIERHVSQSRGLPKGPTAYAPRDGDKLQARATVNRLVKRGRLAHPNTLPCFDCGHVWKVGDKRHEYDHFRGYGPSHHIDVQSVCAKCHHGRSRARGEITHNRSERGTFARK